MSTLSLQNIKKIYPNNAAQTKKKKKHDDDEHVVPEEEKVNLQITEEGVVAVQQFNLEVEDREFIVLVGPSGCGKSTTLRMIAGLEEISDGDLYIDGKWVNNIEPKDRDIAMVFQNYALYPHMTVRENLGFPLKLRKVPQAEINAKVDEVAAMLDITEFLERKPKALSGGQRQRVAIGRALVREPKVLLMDEPLSNLDAKLRNQMRAELIKLRQKIDSTFIYVTHDQTEAMTLGNRIVIMRDGFTQQIGTPQEVFDHPANLFVAGFIGTPQMNFFDGQLIREGKQYFVQLDGFKLPLPEDKCARFADKGVEEQKVTLGVRPNHIHLDQGANTITGTTDVYELMGSEIHLHVTVFGKHAIIIIPTTELTDTPEATFPFGADVTFSFVDSRCHVFDADGNNLD